MGSEHRCASVLLTILQMDEFSVFTHEEVSPELRERFNRAIGPYVSELLSGHDEIVVSGSIVLDVLYGTHFARDIDVFCTPSVAKSLYEAARASGSEIRTAVNPLDNPYAETTFVRFRVMKECVVDVIACKNQSPLEKVASFDLSHNKIAYDGHNLWVHRDARRDGTTSMVYTRVNDFFTDPTDPNHPRKFIKTLCRAAKYTKRGYLVLDGYGDNVYFDEDRFRVLQEWQSRTTDQGEAVVQSWSDLATTD
jgi:hypothetical protein